MAKKKENADDNLTQVREDIKKGSFRPAYLLYGEEAYLVREYKKQLKTAMVGDDQMNYAYYSGKNLNLLEIRDLAMTLPFFAERRLICFEDTGLFSGDSEGFADLVSELPESCHFLFVESAVDRRSKMYKKVSSAGLCCNFARRDSRELVEWVARGFSRGGMGVTREAAQLLVDYTGEDMGALRMEMDKLLSYCIGKDGVRREDVEALCAVRPENRIFEMIEYASRGQAKEALDLYHDLLAMREAPLGILFLLARQMNQLLTIKEMERERKSRDEIAAAMKLNPYVVQKLSAIARAFTGEQLKNSVKECVSREEAVKTGLMGDQIAVDSLLIAISGRIITGAE